MNVQENLLVTLMEECAEVAKAASKILRAGPDSTAPGRRTTNMHELALELTDLMAVVKELEHNGFMLCNWGVFDEAAVRLKSDKLRHFIAVSRQLGCVTGPLAVGEGLSPLYTHVSYPLEQQQ